MTPIESADDALAFPPLVEVIRRGIVTITNDRIKYTLAQERSYDWQGPEEWVRACTVAWLIVEKGYPASRMKLEVPVPRRTPNDHADVVVFADDATREPYLVVENKASGQTRAARTQAIEQVFGNANSLRVPYALYEESDTSFFYNVKDFPPIERTANRLGDRSVVPKEYGNVPSYPHVAGRQNDISPLPASQIEARIRRAHALIWAGGRRDPLTAFDEWSKLLFAKVMDERTTPTGEPRRFQIGTKETTATVANRVHLLFEQACRTDTTIFPIGTRINLTDGKVTDVVQTLQDIAFTRTDVDSIGKAFEQFFGSIFRGGLGQYFTMRQLARFVVAMLDVSHEDFVLDPTAGSGGFLLESLLQVWHRIDHSFAGQPADHIQRIKYDFAKTQVFGIEIHETLARICKINLLLHHDGHTNIEGSRSALDSVFTNPGLNPPSETFTCIVGNPPFGTDIKAGDDEQLGQNELSNFRIAEGLSKVDSEQVIIERCIAFLKPGGRFGLVVPDGILNNQGERSNCPQTRTLLATEGRLLAIISLPDYAFRKSGAQNKTSLVFFEKFTRSEKRAFDREFNRLIVSGEGTAAISKAIANARLSYDVFLGEANQVGYTPSGGQSHLNDLYRSGNNGALNADQTGTILGEWRRFLADKENYSPSTKPDCMAVPFECLWLAHNSSRLDPKYHLFTLEEQETAPPNWIATTVSSVMRRRLDEIDFTIDPERLYKVMTIAQTGEIRPREAGKGKSPPEWRGTYFQDSPGRWYAAKEGDVVFSSIDLWKGCIATVPPDFEGAIVSNEFPIYEVIDDRLSPEFLQILLRSRYYQRAFRAITTGHSNRRRTQAADFEALKIAFPASQQEQQRLIQDILSARQRQQQAASALRAALNAFSDHIDGRGDEELPEVDADVADGDES